MSMVRRSVLIPAQPIQPSGSNLPVYNIYMAYSACQNYNLQSWSQWADNLSCNVSKPPTTVPFGTDVSLPKWAYQSLANGQFDVTTAVQGKV